MNATRKQESLWVELEDHERQRREDERHVVEMIALDTLVRAPASALETECRRNDKPFQRS